MLAAIVPLVAATLCALLIAIAVITRTLDGRASEQTEHTARVLSTSGLPLSQDLLRRLSALQRADFYVLDSAGKVVLTSAAQVPAGVGERLAGSRHATSSVRFDLGGTPVIAAFGALDGSDRRYATLVAVTSLSDVRDAERGAVGAVAVAVLAAAVLLGALVHVLMGSITRPLAALAGLAAELGKGRRDIQIPVSGNDELADLARALNEMVRRIGQYEAKLADQSRLSALGEMSARIAHEVRNPLTGLKMHLQLLSERLPAEEVSRVRLLLDEVRRLELVVDASLMLARPRQAERVVEDLPALVREVVGLMRPSLEHRGIEVECRLDPVPALPLDRALVKQALLNVIANAADALPEGGRLSITTTCDRARGMGILIVEDTGEGFAPELLAEPPPAGSSKPYGLGLGLNVCREVAQLHGGNLELGRSPRGGARVSLALPLEAIARVTQRSA